MPASALRLFHTLRHLRPAQLAAQLRLRVAARRERPELFARRPASGFPGCGWSPRGAFPPPGAQRNPAAALRAGRFVFLNREEPLGFPPDWSAPGLPRLWQYNLHYFEYLWALGFEDGRALLLDWTLRHDLAAERVGWEPYPTSLRLVNWCAWLFGLHRERVDADPELRRGLWESIERQADWLAAHLEFHLLGNHLLENAAALAFCGACFSGEAGARWRRRGVPLLEDELAEQLLEDGGHFERSPMYQARIVYLLQALAWTGDAELEARVEAPLAAAREALSRLCHPDGEIALLNDSALGIANPPSQLGVAEPPRGPFALRDTGYYGARGEGGEYLVCDAAPIGPDYLPGHAHGDIFSFELSLAGRRVVVDAGVHDYEVSELRALCRSTRAHNTVEIEGRDQCEFWAAFRVARRGRPRDVFWQRLGQGFRLEGWHDGYERLPGRPRHRRRFRWHPEGVLLVKDEVTSGRPVEICSRLHLHPDCEILEQGEREVRVRHPGGQFAIRFAGSGRLAVEPSIQCPEFGTVRQGRALVFRAHGDRLETGFCIANRASSLGYDLVAGAQVDGVPHPF